MKSIRVHQFGGPEAMRLEDISLPDPGPGEARVRLEAIGVNFIDVYHRTGLYPSSLPLTPGMEGAGVVDAVGPDVSEVRVGDRVAYAMSQGSYAEYAIVSAAKLVPLPEKLGSREGAMAMLQGMTAHYLARSTFPLREWHTALVHAAAGGVGLLLVQIAKQFGARVIGTVSTEEKARAAEAAGADEIIRYTEVDFETEVKRLTSNEGVHVVYDSVGQATFERSLRCLAPRGMLVLFGQSSGPIPPFDPLVLSTHGSLFVTRPRLDHYSSNRAELLQRAGDVLTWIVDGDLRLTLDRELPLSDAAEAHRLLEGRQTKGKLILRP
jgi:NADPH2:quinone reductase